MIISFSRRFVFIKTRKTAGSSVQHYLSTFCDPKQDIVTGMSEFEGYNWRGTALERPDKTAWGHAPLNIVPALDPANKTPHFFKFTIERNPWDKTVSNWQYFRHRDNAPYTIHEFLTDPTKIPVDWDKYAYGKDVAVHQVAKYETLEDDLEKFCRRVGIKFDAHDFSKFQHKAGTRDDGGDYKQHYDETTKNLVENAFRREIKAFGYTFEGE